MKNFIGTFLVFFLSSTLTFAQFEGIDLNTYKLTDYKIRMLSTSLNTYNSKSYLNTHHTNQFSNAIVNANSLNLSSGGSFGYSSTTYNRHYHGSQGFGLGFNNSFHNSASDDSYNDPFYSDKYKSKTSGSSFNFSLNINTNNRFYISNDYFIGIGFQTNILPYHSYSKSVYNANNDSHTTSTVFNAFKSENSLPLYFGKGRFEDVSDARLAIYIFDDLTKQGRLSRIPSQEEVFAFADFITKTLNKRVIDNRIKKIKEFVAVDSFLVSNGLSTKTDGLYFALINDNWNYSRLQNWVTGSSWSLGVTPSLNYQTSHIKRTDTTAVSTDWERLNEYGFSIDAEYGSSRISGLKWIKGYDIRASFNIFNFDSSGYFEDIINHKSITTSASYIIKYLPNTRTSIICNAGITLNKNLNKGRFDELEIRPSISGACYYYFSEKLRLQINASVNYNYNKIYYYTRLYKTFNYGISATLNYFIF